MEEKTSSASISAEPMQSVPTPAKAAPASVSSPERAIEHRETYGTAKTENLSDSGLWRLILPAAVVVFCIALIIIPLIILIPLLSNSIAAAATGGKEGGLIWLWITMIILELAICAVVIRGFTKIFMTQAGNYR